MKQLALTFLSLYLFLACNSSESSENYRFAAPGELGFNTDELLKLDIFFNELIDEEKIAGAVTLIAKEGTIVLEDAWGWQNIEEERPMKTHHLFRIASMTKAITSLAILQLYDEGLIDFDDPLETYIPEFANPVVLTHFDEETGEYETRDASRSITIQDLLLHTSGIAYTFTHPSLAVLYQREEIAAMLAPRGVTIEETMARLGTLPLAHDPGERYTYGMSTDVLGRIVEIVSGLTLAEYFQRHIFDPLSMNDTGFYLPERQDDLTTLYSIQNGDLVALSGGSSPFNANAQVEDGHTYYAGGAGLLSTARDYFTFLQTMLNGGEWNNRRIISENTLAYMTTDLIGNLWDEDGHGYGLAIRREKHVQDGMRPAGTLYWGGAFQTTYWIDPVNNLVVVMKTQMASSPYGDEINDQFERIIYSAL